VNNIADCQIDSLSEDMEMSMKDTGYEARTPQSECRVSVEHRHLQETCPIRIRYSEAVSNFKQL